MIKKIIASILLGCAILSFVGCDKGTKDSNQSSTAQKAEREDNDKNDKEDKDDEEDNSSNISSNIKDFEFSLDGKVHKLLCDYSELQKEGWEIEDNSKGQELKTNQYTLITVANKGKEEVYFSFYNPNKETKKVEECLVCKIQIDDYMEERCGAKVKLAGGIGIGSTVDELEEAFGEPTSKNEYEDYIYYKYDFEIYSNYQFIIDSKTKKITKIEARNIER